MPAGRFQAKSSPMPWRRAGHTTTVTIGSEDFRLTANQRADGTLGEVLIGWRKQGSTCAGLLDAYGTALTVGLQHGVPLAALLKPSLGLSFTPSGHTDDPEIPRARSAVDYFSRRLAIDWLPYPERAALGILTMSERVAQAGAWTGARELSPVRLLRWELAADRGGSN